MPMSSDTSLRSTPLRELHVGLGARMVAFAGHELPLSFRGAVEEHLHTRTCASLFDVSHMRVCDVVGSGAATALEQLTPSRLTDLGPRRSRYLVLANAAGGIIDDSIATRMAAGIRLVLNASRADADLEHLRKYLGDSVRDRVDLGLVALQGPHAARVLRDLGVDVAGLVFMQSRPARFVGADVEVSRSGYTGEDGFELTVAADRLHEVAERLLSHESVAPAGLAARDSLRLEAGLCLYGQDLDETTSPIEAGLTWTIPPERRVGGSYLGAAAVATHVREGPPRRLVGLRPCGRRPVRSGARLYTPDGEDVGIVTSGGWGPSVAGPIAMGYVRSSAGEVGADLRADVRGHVEPCEIVGLPFLPHRYVRAGGRS